MKPFITDPKTKRQCYKKNKRYPWKPMKNRGKLGKRRSVNKWRSRKAKRRLDKVNICEVCKSPYCCNCDDI